MLSEASTTTSTAYPDPVRRFECGFGNESYEFMIKELIDMFNRIGGMFGGFRFYDRQEFSTNDYIDPPTMSDQQCVVVDAEERTFQITRWYGTPGGETSRRRIRKPRQGTVLASIRSFDGVYNPINDFSIDYTRGIITLGENRSRPITAITNASQAVITVGSAHPFVIGDSVIISGVTGMTQINELRSSVVSTSTNTITVSVNSTGFGVYASGGTVQTGAQFYESLYAGCEFDIPVRFETDLSGITYANYNVLSTVISLVEILNPYPK